MATFETTRADYAATWQAMAIVPAKRPIFDRVATRLHSSLPLYQSVEALTGVPACLIMVIHERESGGRFSTHLHNGDPLTARTVHVPPGRPLVGNPPFSWQESARDALRMKNLDQVREWTVERALYVLEGYNGFGYRNRGLRSPYLWGGTNQQQPGKYVADGKFDPTAIDGQLGCAGLLSALWTIDPAMRLPMAGEAVQTRPPATTPKHPRPAAPPPGPSPVQQGGIAAAVAALIGGFLLFRDQVVAFFHHLFWG